MLWKKLCFSLKFNMLFKYIPFHSYFHFPTSSDFWCDKTTPLLRQFNFSSSSKMKINEKKIQFGRLQRGKRKVFIVMLQLPSLLPIHIWMQMRWIKCMNEKKKHRKTKEKHHVQSRFLFCKLCRRYISIKSDSFDDLRSEKKSRLKTQN